MTLLAGNRVRASDANTLDTRITAEELSRYVEITSNPTGVTSATLADISGLSLSASLTSGRSYLVTFKCRGVQTTSGTTDVSQIAITAAGTVIDDGFWITSGGTSARWKPVLWARYVAAATGSVTFTVQQARVAGGAGTTTIGASATSPASLWVVAAGIPT